jgi:hypothetical protein
VPLAARYRRDAMEERAERLGVSWGWRAVAGVGGLLVIALAFASAPSEGWQVAASFGLLGLVLSFWSDASIALHVSAWGIRPADPRKPPMAWSDVRDVVPSSTGIDLFDAAGRKLSLSGFGERHEELVRRAFFHAVASHRSTASLPFTRRTEENGPAVVFAVMAAACGLGSISVLARDDRGAGVSMGFACIACVSAAYAWWLWRRRTIELRVDEEGVTSVRGSKQHRLPHGTAIDLVTVQQGQFAVAIWDAEARQIANEPLRTGLAHYVAHLTLAMRIDAPVVPPFEPRTRSDRHASLRAHGGALLAHWVGPSLGGSVLAFVVSPAEPVQRSDAHFPGVAFVVFALAVASALATMVRYRERVRWLAVALGACTGVVGVLTEGWLSAELESWQVAVLSALVEGVSLTIAALVLGRAELRDDERTSDILQLGAAFGCVSLPLVPASPWFALAVPFVPMVTASVVALAALVRSAAATRAQRRVWVPLAATGAFAWLALGRMEELDARAWQMLALLGLGAAVFVTHERQRRATLAMREAGASATKLFWSWMLTMIAGLVYVASRLGAAPQLVSLWLAPVLAFGMSWIAAGSGTHAMPEAPGPSAPPTT